MKEVLPALKTPIQPQTLLPFTLSVGLRWVQFGDCAKPASHLPAAPLPNPKAESSWSCTEHCLIYWKKNKSKEATFACSTFPFASLPKTEPQWVDTDPKFVQLQVCIFSSLAGYYLPCHMGSIFWQESTDSPGFFSKIL